MSTKEEARKAREKSDECYDQQISWGGVCVPPLSFAPGPEKDTTLAVLLPLIPAQL